MNKVPYSLSALFAALCLNLSTNAVSQLPNKGNIKAYTREMSSSTLKQMVVNHVTHQIALGGRICEDFNLCTFCPYYLSVNFNGYMGENDIIKNLCRIFGVTENDISVSKISQQEWDKLCEKGG